MKNKITLHIILCGLLISAHAQASETSSELTHASSNAYASTSSSTSTHSPRTPRLNPNLSNSQDKLKGSPPLGSQSPIKDLKDALKKRVSEKKLNLLHIDSFSDSEERFITTTKGNKTYKCLIINTSGDSDNKEYMVAIQTTSNNGKIFTIDTTAIPTNNKIYQEVLRFDDNSGIVIDASHYFYTWDGNATYTPLSYGENYTPRPTETPEKKEIHNNEQELENYVLNLLSTAAGIIKEVKTAQHNPIVPAPEKTTTPTTTQPNDTLQRRLSKEALDISEGLDSFDQEKEPLMSPSDSESEDEIKPTQSSPNTNTNQTNSPAKSPLPISAQPIAHITNVNNRTYLCYLSDDNTTVKVYLLTNDQFAYSKPTFTTTISTSPDFTMLASLVNIDNDQCVYIDSNLNFHIKNGETYIPQSTKYSDHSIEAFRNTIFIKPLPEVTSHTGSTSSTTDDSQEQNDSSSGSSDGYSKGEINLVAEIHGNNTIYQCSTMTHEAGLYWIEIKSLDSKNGIIIYPDEMSDYTELIKIDENQIVCIDKNRKFYIADSNDFKNSILMAQDNYNENSILIIRCAADTNIIKNDPITPEEVKELNPIITEKQKETGENTTNSLSTNPSIAEKLTPESSQGASKTPYIIGGGLTIAAILAILHYYDKLPNIAELFNNMYAKVQNFNFAQ